MKNKIKSKIISSTASVLSAPARAYYGTKGKISNMKADVRVANRNFKNRQDNTNMYRGVSYWKKNTN